jgi:hypothetical protein
VTIKIMLESLKILILSIAAAILYGIIHDQFTARICIEYFTVFHPPVFRTQSPTLLALGWGVIATWWVGAFLGLLLILAARFGSRPKLRAVQLVRPIGKLLLVMASCAFIAGLTAFLLTKTGASFETSWNGPAPTMCSDARFVADQWAHSTSCTSGFIGGIILCVLQYLRRHKLNSPQVRPAS